MGGEALAGVLVRAVAAKETARVAAQGLCFPALFSAALAVGALSRYGRAHGPSYSAAQPHGANSPREGERARERERDVCGCVRCVLHARRRRVFGQVQAAGAGAGVQARAAAVTAESSDFHAQLAYRNDLRPPGTHPMVQQRHWRWNGVLTGALLAATLPGAAPHRRA